MIELSKEYRCGHVAIDAKLKKKAHARRLTKLVAFQKIKTPAHKKTMSIFENLFSQTFDNKELHLWNKGALPINNNALEEVIA